MPNRDFAGSRVLVLGNGGRATQARSLLASAGAELKHRFDATVTFVVVDRTVPAGHHEVGLAVARSIPVLTTSQLRERMGAGNAMLSAPLSPAASPVPPEGPTLVPPSMAPPPPPMAVPPPVRMPPPPPVSPPARIPSPVPVSPPVYRRRVPPRPPQVPARRGGTAWGVGAVAFVLATVGFGAGPVIGYVAWREKAANQWPFAIGYMASAGLMVAGVSAGFPWVFLSAVLLAVNMVVGGVHAFYVTEKLARRLEGANVLTVSEARNRAAIAQVDSRRKLREESRRLADEDPAKARELRIGRPDLQRSYDDGGLVDVNSAPAAYLMTIPGMSREVAEEIIEWRRDNGPFHSTAEVMVHTSLGPKAAEQIDGFALYLE